MYFIQCLQRLLSWYKLHNSSPLAQSNSGITPVNRFSIETEETPYGRVNTLRTSKFSFTKSIKDIFIKKPTLQ